MNIKSKVCRNICPNKSRKERIQCRININTKCPEHRIQERSLMQLRKLNKEKS